MFKVGDIVRIKNALYSTYDKEGKIGAFDAAYELAPYFVTFKDERGGHFAERDLELIGELKSEKTDNVQIKDSGNRREFETGAVRDIQEGKGRCDLVPLDVVALVWEDCVLFSIAKFQEFNDISYLIDAVIYFTNEELMQDRYDVILKLAKHFEQGAKKYGENNWQKGIPTHCYIDSAVRHYLKYMRGDKDEPHDIAFMWNLICCIWTCVNKPQLNDYERESSNENDC